MIRRVDARSRHKIATGTARVLAVALISLALAGLANAGIVAPATTVEILAPVAENPVSVGGFVSPADLTVELRPTSSQGFIRGLGRSAFQVKLGALAANVVVAAETSDAYILRVRPPAQQAAGFYDLNVTVSNAQDTETGAVYYSTDSLANVDVSLSIDRSGSMTADDAIGKAKQAASLFLQRMRPGDKIGVVSFSDYSIEHLKLLPVLDTSEARPVFTEDFEGNVGEWGFVTPWAVTTEASHSPTKSITDTPGSQYPNSFNKSAITPELDLTGVIRPALTFWHIYDLEESYDFGRIFATADNFATAPTFVGSVTGRQLSWVQRTIDLLPMAGKSSVKLLFNVLSDNIGTRDGWHIDDVQVTELDALGAALAAIDGIEAYGATSIGAGLRQSQIQLIGIGAPSGDYVMTDSPNGVYQNGANFQLISPAIDLTNVPDPEFRFISSHAYEPGYDFGIISVSVDGGQNFTEVTRLTGIEVNYKERRFALPQAGGKSNVRLEFRALADSDVLFDGWYFDNAEVRSISNPSNVAFFDDFETVKPGWLRALPWARFRATGDADRFHPWAIILLSDGFENTAPAVADVLPHIENTKIRVFSIALGEESDQNLLRSIAERTGGEFFFAPNASDLAYIYNSLAGEITGEESILVDVGMVQQGATNSHDVAIDESVTQATFAFNSTNSANVLGFELRTPSGGSITPATQAAGVQYFPTGSGGVMVIKNPAPGVWKMRITGQTVPGGARPAPADLADRSSWVEIAGDTMPAKTKMGKLTPGAEYDFQISAVTSLRLGAQLYNTPQTTGAGIKTLAILSDDEPVKSADVKATLIGPEGNVTITLHDDGAHGDGAADDGVYGGEFDAVDAAGAYTIKLSAQGGNPQVFTRSATLNANIVPSDLRDLIRQYLLGLIGFNSAYNINSDSDTDIADLVRAHTLPPSGLAPPTKPKSDREPVNLYAPPEIPFVSNP